MVNIHFVKEELAITKEINNLMKGVSKKERLELENIFRKNRLEDLVKEHKQLFVKTTPKHNMHTRQYTDDDAESTSNELSTEDVTNEDVGDNITTCPSGTILLRIHLRKYHYISIDNDIVTCPLTTI